MAGETGSTRSRIWAAAPHPLPLPKPIDAATFTSSSTRGALPPSGAGGLPGEKVAQEDPKHGRGLRDPHTFSTSFVLSSCNRKPCSQAALHSPSPSLSRRAATSHGCYSLTTKPFLAANRSPPSSGGLYRGDPTPGRVPTALCDLPAWRRWVPLHPPHPAGHFRALSLYAAGRFPGAPAPTDVPRFSKCYGHPDFSLIPPSPGKARGASLPLSVPQFPRGSLAEATTHDTVGHW